MKDEVREATTAEAWRLWTAEWSALRVYHNMALY